MAEPQVQYCTTEDGASIAYATMGAGPVVLMPSNAQSFAARLRLHPFQRALCEALAARFTLVQYDGRGMGLSARERAEHGLEARLRDLDAVVAAVGGETFSLCGYFVGGLTAIAYAARHPDRVLHLVLIDAISSGERYITETPGGRMREALVPVVTDQWEYVSDALGGPAERDRFPEAGSDVVREAFGAAIRETWTPSAYLAHQQAFRETDVSGELTAIAVPTLVISTATPERGFFELARDLARAIPKARLLRVTQRWDGWEGRDYETLVTFLSEGAQPSGARTPVAPAAVRTVLFTDLVGHTEMMQRLGDARGRDVLREHERITRETLKNHDGAEVKTMGDGFMASFGSVTQAMECAIALQRAFAAHTASMPEPLHVRVGLNAGEPIEEDGDLFGSTVILASRIAAQAGAGEILVPETVRGLLSGKPFVYADRGEFVPKGFDDAVRLYEVRWREEAETP